MSQKKFHISGRVINRKSRQGIPNLRVEVWDKDLIFNDLVVNVVTDKQGNFQIEFTEDRFQECFGDRQPDLFFKVFNQNEQICSTEDSVLWNVEAGETEITIEVDVKLPEPEPNGEQPKSFVVKGTVRQADGSLFIGAIVKAFDKDLRSEQLLGEKLTNQDGYYEITYTRAQFQRAEKNSADLIVRVFNRAGELQVASPIIFNAQPVEIVDLTGGSDPQKLPEYEQIIADLRPLLGNQSIANLREDDADNPEAEKYQDISFLSGETGWSNDRLEHLVVSHRLRDRSKIEPEFFYALLREDILLKVDIASALQVRFAITLKTPLQPLFYDIVLLTPEDIRQTIKQAIDRGIVPAALTQQLDDILKILSQHIEEAKSYYQNEQPRRILNLIEKNITSGKVEEVLKILQTDIHGNIPKLLEQLTQVDFFLDADEANNARTNLQLGEILGFDEQIIERVKTLQKIEQPEDVRRLAALNRADWKALLTQSADRLTPNGTPLNQNLIDFHASSLVRKMEVRFPTVAFAAQLERDTLSERPSDRNSPLNHRTEMVKVLNDHPDFDLATTNIDAFFKQKDVTFNTEVDTEQIKDNLKAVQRIFKFTPNYRQTNTLLREGIHSAQGIYAMGETQFVKQFTDNNTFTQKEAQKVYQKAADIHTATIFLATEIKAQMQAMEVHALAVPEAAAKLEAVTKEFPNLETLFKLTDLCECEHCRSVYSPAAYLADVLQFLKNRKVKDTTIAGSGSVKKAKDALFDRRSDIGDLDLSCENTNTPLPYIDVVCELLEEAIAPDTGMAFNGAIAIGAISQALFDLLKTKLPVTLQATIYGGQVDASNNYLNYVLRDKNLVCKITSNGSGSWIVKRLRQTHLSAAELAAAPEYLNEEAYKILQTSHYAFHLPFDLFHQEARSYFEQFDVRRADLMHVLQVAANPADYAIAAEALGITDEERKLIVTPNPSNQNLYWNTGTPSAAPVMKVVDTFLQKSELTYIELTELLELSFINPDRKLFIKHLDNTCDTHKKEIANLDDTALDRIHRFLRLWQKTSWKMATLNRAILYPRLGNGQLDDTALVKIYGLMKLQEKLGLSLDELCIFYGLIPTEGENSRYQQLFLNPAANGVIDEAFEPEKVRQNEQQEATTPGSGKKLSDAQIKATLSLCLTIKPEDVTKLVDSLGSSAILSFANIAAVYSMNLLAKTLGFTAEEFLTLRSLAGISVFASPTDTLKFVEQAEKIKASGMKVADVQYLLIHQAPDLSDRILKEEKITTFLTNLQREYQKSFEATKSPYDDALSADENKSFVKEYINKLPNFSAVDVTQFMSILDDNWQDITQTPAAFIDNKLSQFINTTPIKAAQAALAGAAAPKETERKALIQVVLDTLADYFFRQEKKSILTKAVVDTFKVSEETASIVLENARLKEPAIASPQILLELLTTDALIDKTPPIALPAISSVAFVDQYRAVRLLHKMLPFIIVVQLKPEEVEWMLKHNALLGWMELDRLPYDSGIASINIELWEKFTDGLNLIKAYPPVANPLDRDRPYSFYTLLEKVLQPAAIDDVLQYLSKLTGWDKKVLQDLNAHFALSVPVPNYKTPSTYLQLEQAVILLRKLDIDLATAKQLIKAKLSATEVSLIRAALKLRYEDTQWLEVLKGIHDKLRHQKRDALVAYLLAVNPDMKTSSDLYDYFLIDVEMCACQPTSRIVQAHGTLQLFIQRCLMGLEPRAVADVKEDNGWNQWKWMKNYRVWEANRKVFLYPENWIEPELRDDKSFLFKDLETELLQNELSDRTVEDATINYLEKLDEIAFLEVVAVYYQTDIYTMHVFARTKGGEPAVYYYRRFEKERYWTPWEKVDLDITSDHLMAFVRNNRLYLAWAVFTEEPKPDQSIKIPKPSEVESAPPGGKNVENTKKRWKVQLAISEYTSKKWLPKKVSKEGLSPQFYSEFLPPKENFRFTILDLGNAGFTIACTYEYNGWNYLGSFELTGCKGYPEISRSKPFSGFQFLPQFKDTAFKNMRYREMGQDQTDDLAALSILYLYGFLPILEKTPGTFKITYPHQMSLIDYLLFLLQILFLQQQQYGMVAFAASRQRQLFIPLGTFMPHFYEDGNKNYVIIPGYYKSKGEKEEETQIIEKTFSDILKFWEDVIALILKYWQKLLDDPQHDFQKVLAELVKDTEYIRLTEEFKVYQTLVPGLKFKNFYHPLVCYLRSTLYRDGIPALMQRDTQLHRTDFKFGPDPTYKPNIEDTYKPTPSVAKPYPIENLDFERGGSYASYNWELFFHLPFLMAVKLNQNQRFEEAMNWFHYVFNPIGALEGTIPQKYWVTKPFFEYESSDYIEQRIDKLLNDIAADPTGATITELKFAIEEWRSKPFQPHVIARSRPVAYQKAVLMKYIDNLIDWGDNLFRQDTMESVNQATQLYILAEKLLGPKPRIIPPVVKPPYKTYNQLESKLDLFSNALLKLENLIPDLNLLPHKGAELPAPPLTLSSLYFCIPQNDKMLEYWDRVADRLFKIRHCQNIEGVERILALFAPPIDPGALVRAAAAGLDISQIISGLNAPLPFYRFNVMAQKATELTQEVRALGSALLQALEKKDAEAMALLRSQLEIKVLTAVKDVKEQQIKEAETQIEGLKKSRAAIEERLQYYANIQKIIPNEQLHLDKLRESQTYQELAQYLQVEASIMALIPDFDLGASGFGGTPVASATFGGKNIAQGLQAASGVLSFLSLINSNIAATASTKGSFDRRWEDWKLQERLAAKELEQYKLSDGKDGPQITAAQIRLDIAKKDLQNHLLQIENAQKTDKFMRSKFTNEELYNWTIAQISSVYFQAYQLAYDVAKKAERCFQHELASDSTFLQFGYWDSLKKGLMAADHLFHDLKRMEVAYLDQNKREYELTKHISLAMLDPIALIQLKNTGKCSINLPEALFDLDHPGHYMRRLKSVSLSIPCVAGPYTSVSCKLSLVSNKYRKNTAFKQGATTDKDKYAEAVGNDDRFVYNIGTIQSIATSTAQNDSGMFELNFRDERYLPFEGTGAIATWQLEMPKTFKQFDYSTISDVIIHLKYTARDGGKGFKDLVEGVLKDFLNAMVLEASRTGLFLAFNLKHEFPNEWYRLKQTKSVSLNVSKDRLPFYVQDRNPHIDSTTWIARIKDNPATLTMSLNGSNFNLNPDANLNNLCKGASNAIALDTDFSLSATNTDALEELWLVCHYSVT
jgi:hypothetical protein